MTPTSKTNEEEIQLTENSKVSVDIRLFDEKGNPRTLSLPSFVEKVHHDSSFLIRMPTHQDNYYTFPRDEMCLIYFTAKSGENCTPGVFAMPVSFIEKIERGNLVYARMEPLGKIEKSQRRDCYRLPLSMPLTLKRGNKDTSPASVTMLDFSDGGMLLSTCENLEINETVVLDFNIGRKETVKGVVVRKEPKEKGKREYKIAIKFSSTDSKQKQRFYRFIMEKQLENRKRQAWAL